MIRSRAAAHTSHPVGWRCVRSRADATNQSQFTRGWITRKRQAASDDDTNSQLDAKTCLIFDALYSLVLYAAKRQRTQCSKFYWINFVWHSFYVWDYSLVAEKQAGYFCVYDVYWYAFVMDMIHWWEIVKTLQHKFLGLFWRKGAISESQIAFVSFSLNTNTRFQTIVISALFGNATKKNYLFIVIYSRTEKIV